MNTLLIILALAFLAFLLFYAWKQIGIGNAAAERYNVAQVVWTIFWLIIVAGVSHDLLDLLHVLFAK